MYKVPYLRFSLFSLTICACLIVKSQDFNNLKTESAAIKTGDRCYTITPDAQWQTGAIWGDTKVDLTQDFEFEFEMNFGDKKDPLGADGMTFILSKTNNINPGTGGQKLGVGGISPEIHVEFDVFQNIGVGGYDDPNVSHIAVLKNGNGTHLDPAVNLSKTPSNQGFVQMHPSKPNVQDGMWYDVLVSYKSATTELFVYFDNTLRERVVVDISNEIFSGDTEVYWGITGSSGGETNVHQVCFKEDTIPTTVTTKKYVIPNAFTPNGDLSNDVFEIKTTANVQVSRLLIYSRWGNVLYDGTNSWDGKTNGKEVPNGVYLVVAELTDKNGIKTNITGDVTIIR